MNKNYEDFNNVKLFDRELSEKNIPQNCTFPVVQIGLFKSRRPVLGHMPFSKPIIGKKSEITMIDLEQSFRGMDIGQY